MLHVWNAPLARATKDLDFLGRLDDSLENLERVVCEVCAADVEPDGMVFRGRGAERPAWVAGVSPRYASTGSRGHVAIASCTHAESRLGL
jgi:hypothetical protein